MQHELRGWPIPVAAYIRTAYGEPRTRERLGGMSGGYVERVRFSDSSLVVKASTSVRERQFYQRVAGALARHGVATPRLYWSTVVQDTVWLLLEDIPHMLPRSRWSTDGEVLDALRRLHRATVSEVFNLPDPFVPIWTDRLTAEALSCFPAEVAAEFTPMLSTLQSMSSPLFDSWCAISGDPNPSNWGLRADGTLVLFDWERYGRGTPGLDLAIAVPGLSERAVFEHVASTYLTLWQQDGETTPWSTAHLSRNIALAKVWSVIEFMSDYVAGNSAIPATTIEFLVEHVPAWMRQVHHQLA